MRDDTKRITTDALQDQVRQYTTRLPDYKIFADALKGALESACQSAFPEAFVQARPKAVTSFAEKCVRKFTQYPNAVDQMNDLCGARVIVQTLEQVRAVRSFIEHHFDIVESDEKGSLLGTDKFGYRDMHYIVRLPAKSECKDYVPDEEAAAALGFSPNAIGAIGAKTAEIQVRTWVQHAWADVLHDRMYKTKLKYPAEFERTASLLAAIMEEGDRDFDRLAGDIDGMLANFNAYAPREEVESELEVQELILETAEPKKKPAIALQIARLIAAQGDDDRVVTELMPYADIPSPLGCAIRLELGQALCKQSRANPESEIYRAGQRQLRRVVEHCRAESSNTATDLRRRTSTLAKALARLAWTYEALDEDAALARDCYREALELEPGNPYYLADVIGHEISYSRRKDFVGAMAAEVRRAIATCCEHIRNGTEMPYAAFTAGRLHLLLDESDRALGTYARGIRHVLDCTSCVPRDVLDVERKWLILVTNPDRPVGGYRWAMDLLKLAASRFDNARHPEAAHAGAKPTMNTPVLIVAGGATSLKPGQVDQLRPMLESALAGFEGTVIAGGTRVGVPGCVGDAADMIGPRGKRPFKLIGYMPRVKPGDAPTDDRYDVCIACGEQSFTAEQILKNWADLVAAGVCPDDVRLLGFGGGPLSAVEYRVALGFGACVGLVVGSGGAADALLEDDLWRKTGNLWSLPCDPASARALAHPPHAAFAADTLESMAKAFHEDYVRNSTSRLPDNMKPWKKLKDTFKTANQEQAKYSVQILEACGFKVRPAKEPKITVTFTPEEIECMAEMEHGRWNVERLSNGWRPGQVRDDEAKIQPCIIAWADLPEEIRHYDRDAVRQFPAVLAQAGLEVHRVGATTAPTRDLSENE